jgi:cyclase
MLKPRITPCLLIQNNGLVKTQKFANPKYVGDPINAVKIFNEKEVDELIIMDIDASALGREPNYKLIRSLANECRMPLCYGGGVKTVEQAERIIQLGVEKVAISSAAISNPDFIAQTSKRVGSQSLAVVLDIKKSGILRRYEVFIQNGKIATGLNPSDLVKKLEVLGAGEIVINSIDQDGQMQGYDLSLIESIRECTSLPLTALGGAGSMMDIQDLIKKFGIIGAAAGSLFVFKGKYRAVLINYPARNDKDALIRVGMGRE